MNARHCLQIARRIGSELERRLGEGIDADRMLTEPAYARDVLLVCDAMRSDGSGGSDGAPPGSLPALARHYRTAELEEEERESVGAVASRFFSSLFGRQPTAQGIDEQQPRAARPRARPGR